MVRCCDRVFLSTGENHINLLGLDLKPGKRKVLWLCLTAGPLFMLPGVQGHIKESGGVARKPYRRWPEQVIFDRRINPRELVLWRNGRECFCWCVCGVQAFDEAIIKVEEFLLQTPVLHVDLSLNRTRHLTKNLKQIKKNLLTLTGFCFKMKTPHTLLLLLVRLTISVA